jgi:hypothetical protein
MTPTIATTVGQLTITNTKDVNNFVYPSLYSLANLSFVPVPPSLSSISVSNLTTGLLTTGLLATFNKSINAVSSITVLSGGTGTVTSIVGTIVTFSITATTAGVTNLVFNGVTSTEGSSAVSLTYAITVTDPVVADAQFWLDASQSSTITQSGGKVTSWASVDGLAPSTTNLHATIKPTLDAASLNGMATIHLHNNNAGGVANYWQYTKTFGTVYTMFAVVKIHSASGSYSGGFFWLKGQNFGHSIGDYQKSGTATATIKINSGDIGGNSHYTPIDIGLPPTGWFLVEMRNGGINPFVRAANSTKRVLSSYTDTLDIVNVGGTGGHCTECSIAELRCYIGGLDDTKHDIVAAQLRTKWGIV